MHPNPRQGSSRLWAFARSRPARRPRPDRRRIAHRALRGRQLYVGRAKPHVALPSFPFPGGAQIRRTPRRSCRANLVRGTGGRRRIAYVRPIEIDGTGPRDNVQSLSLGLYSHLPLRVRGEREGGGSEHYCDATRTPTRASGAAQCRRNRSEPAHIPHARDGLAAASARPGLRAWAAGS